MPRWSILAGSILLLILSATGTPAADRGSVGRQLSAVKRSLSAGDAEALEAALGPLIESGGRSAARGLLSLVQRVPPGRDRLYWTLVEGVASFKDADALQQVGSFLSQRRSRGVARDLVYALARNRGRHVVGSLAPLLEKPPDDLRRMVAESLGRVPTPEAVEALIGCLERLDKDGKADSSLGDVVAESLAWLTGKRFGPNAVNWRGWWKAHPDHPLRAGGRSNGDGDTGTAVDSLSGRRRAEFVGLEKAPKERFVVLSAEYTKETQRDLNNDHMEEILDRMGVPHIVVRREDFLGHDLSRCGAILINCAQFHRICICPDCKPAGEKNDRLYRCSGCDKHIPFSAALTGEQIAKLRGFVAAGGYVFSEDWAISEFVEKAYPEYAVGGDKLAEGDVDVVPARGMAAHPYLRGIFDGRVEGAEAILDAPDLDLEDIEDILSGAEEDDEDYLDDDDPEEDEEPSSSGRTVVASAETDESRRLLSVEHRWQIDDESYALRVVEARRVLALLRSGELEEKVGEASLVAFAIRPKSSVPPGRRTVPKGTPGVVLQVLSHFGKQGSRADEHSIENLLVNFLLDANATFRRRGRGRR